MEVNSVIAVVGLGINILVAIFVVAAFLWRIPTRDDLKRVEDKADDANRQIMDISGDIKVLTATMERIESWFDSPALKSSRRRQGPDE